MPQTLASVYIHWVFSTKHRKPFLQDKNVRNEVHAALGEIAKRLDCMPLRVGGVEDHVHMLTTLSRTLSIADAIKEFKRASNYWIAGHHSIPEFKWQSGYGAFSVSRSQLDAVIEYIKDQEMHHKEMTFQDEFRAMLKRHGVEFDEQFVWD